MTKAPRKVRVFAPGSIGNVGPGLDILGCAVTGLGDTVIAERVAISGVTIRDPGNDELPNDPLRHTSGLAALEVLRRSARSDVGMALSVEKGLPLCGGQGGSAASAVAGAVAANELLGRPLGSQDLMAACLAAEETVSGRHADNIAPCLLGGLVLIRCLEPLDVVQLPTPPELIVVLAQPDLRLRTAESRSVLPSHIERGVALHQSAQIAALVAGLVSRDFTLIGRALDDRIAEPARAPLLPGFRDAKAAAIGAGALGASISGAGPAAFALVLGEETADRVADAMAAAYRAAGVACTVRVARIDQRGARVEHLEETAADQLAERSSSL